MATTEEKELPSAPPTALKQLYDELVKVEGVALCLIDVTEYISPHSGHEKFRYLGQRLKEHCTAALSAVDEIENAGDAA
jgi:hypothetical protein